MGTSQLIKYIVSGDSMSPLLVDGQSVLVDPSAIIYSGDIVVATHPIQTDLTIIKKVSAILENGSLRLIGTNEKMSSHNFGPVRPDFVIGKVVMNLDEKSENL